MSIKFDIDSFRESAVSSKRMYSIRVREKRKKRQRELIEGFYLKVVANNTWDGCWMGLDGLGLDDEDSSFIKRYIPLFEPNIEVMVHCVDGLGVYFEIVYNVKKE